MSTMEKLKANREKILALALEKGLRDVRVFGSAARGDDTDESDIDLLVNISDASDPLAFLDFQESVSKMLAKKVDIVFERGLYPALRQSILGDAKPL